jgi:hypothetical protein
MTFYFRGDGGTADIGMQTSNMLISTRPDVTKVHGKKRLDPGTSVRYGMFWPGTYRHKKRNEQTTVAMDHARVTGGIDRKN